MKPFDLLHVYHIGHHFSMIIPFTDVPSYLLLFPLIFIISLTLQVVFTLSVTFHTVISHCYFLHAHIYIQFTSRTSHMQNRVFPTLLHIPNLLSLSHASPYLLYRLVQRYFYCETSILKRDSVMAHVSLSEACKGMSYVQKSSQVSTGASM